MTFQDDRGKAFRDERFGTGAGIPTTLGGTLGQISARQQNDLESGRVRNGASGALILEMVMGAVISRDILVLVVGCILGVAAANSGPSSGWIGAAIALGTLRCGSTTMVRRCWLRSST